MEVMVYQVTSTVLLSYRISWKYAESKMALF